LAVGPGTSFGGPDRAQLGEAIAVIRPLADAGDDVAELWLARWLADPRIRQLKASRRHLDRRLARAGDVDELRQRAENRDDYAQYYLDEITGRS
jgi:hypothetical protein